MALSLIDLTFPADRLRNQKADLVPTLYPLILWQFQSLSTTSTASTAMSSFRGPSHTAHTALAPNHLAVPLQALGDGDQDLDDATADPRRRSPSATTGPSTRTPAGWPLK